MWMSFLLASHLCSVFAVTQKIRPRSKGDSAEGSSNTRQGIRSCLGTLGGCGGLGLRDTSRVGKDKGLQKGLGRVDRRIEIALFNSHSITCLLLRAI